MMWVRVFSAVYGGISRVKRPHLGVVGSILGKEMGKESLRAQGESARHRLSGFIVILRVMLVSR